MATSNFHNENASAIFAVQLEHEFDYDDLVENLKSELNNDPDYVDYGKTDKNELRSFPSRTLGSIRKYVEYKDFYVEVCVTPVIRSGYYSGVNLDWNVDYLINGDASYDTPEFYIDDITAFKAEVNKDHADRPKGNVYAISTGTHTIIVTYKDNVIYKKQIFVSAQETKKILLP